MRSEYYLYIICKETRIIASTLWVIIARDAVRRDIIFETTIKLCLIGIYANGDRCVSTCTLSYANITTHLTPGAPNGAHRVTTRCHVLNPMPK